MPRRSGVPKREVLPDPVYNSTVVTKVVNQIMLDGKRESRRKSFTVHSIQSKKNES